MADSTRRFSQRPFFTTDELDRDCEHTVIMFMQERCDQIIYPIPTDVLTKLIERDADDLDLYADLSAEGDNVEAVTEFYPPHKPKVRIAAELSQQAWRAHRLRTTLCHEYAHVRLHAPVVALESMTPSMFPELKPKVVQKCKRENILDAAEYDWMEWQAGYVCGAILMPKSEITKVASTFVENRRLYTPLKDDGSVAMDLMKQVSTYFDTSQEAAKVRLLKLQFLSKSQTSRPLFL